MKPFRTMFKTELMLSIRSMDMVIFALCMPVAAIVIIGMLGGNKPAFQGAGYTFLAQSFGAVSSISICASGVMGLPLVISDYRYKKILKRFQVTPVSSVLILMVQIAIYIFYALASLLFVYVTAAVFFGFQMKGSPLLFLGSFLLVLFSMYSIGLMIGGISPNTKITNLLCCILYFPMLIFSGATLPYEVMPSILQETANFLPLTQGIKLMKAASLGLPAQSVVVPVIVMIVFAVICTSVAIRFFRWE